MKRILFPLVSLIMALGLALPVPAQAQDVTEMAASTWYSRIAYVNPGTAETDIEITYYAEDGSPSAAVSTIENVPANGSGVILVGATVRGSAVVSADPGNVLAVYEQISGDADQKYGRPLYTAMDATYAGGTILLPAFYYQYVNYITSTRFVTLTSTAGVQNITDSGVQVTISDGASTLHTVTIPPQSSYIFKGSDPEIGLPAGYSGPLVITAPANSVVAAVEVEQEDGRRAFAYEGLSQNQAAQRIIMPYLVCSTSTKYHYTQYYIQALENAVVDVSFYTSAGTLITPRNPALFSGLAIPARQHILIDPCADPRLVSKSGSAVITSTTGKIVAVGLTQSTTGVGTAFTSQTTPSNSTYRYILPYVTWARSSSESRTYISILNIGSATAVTQVYYYRQDGTLATTKNPSVTFSTHKPNAIKSTNPYTAGARKSYVFNGSVVIVSTQPLIVRARLQRSVSKVSGTTKLAEDYLGIYWP